MELASNTVLGWAEAPSEVSVLLGLDIGGTNTRIRIVAIGDHSKNLTLKYKTSRMSDIKNTLAALSKYFQEKAPRVRFWAASVAGAGPVAGNGSAVTLTNFIGTLEERTLAVADLPPHMFPTGKTQCINDLTGTCFGLVSMVLEDELDLHVTSLFPQEEPSGAVFSTLRPVLVLAIGTGMGCGLLLPQGGQQFSVLPMEGSHALIEELPTADPHYETDKEIKAFISQKRYEGRFAPEYEDVCSGHGLLSCYEFFKERDQVSAPILEEPGHVAALAASAPLDALSLNHSVDDFEAGVLCAGRALTFHYQVMFRSAQTLAVSLRGAAVVICGDNLVHNHKFVMDRKDEWKRTIVQHPRGAAGWMDIPFLLQTTTENLNLIGSIHVAHQLL